MAKNMQLPFILMTKKKWATLWNKASLLREPWGIPYAKYAWQQEIRVMHADFQNKITYAWNIFK